MKKIINLVWLIFLTSCSQPIIDSLNEQTSEVELLEKDSEIVQIVKTLPVITFSSDILKTVWNKPIDLFDGVTAIDYLGNKIEVQISGEYSFKSIDTYELYYVATDFNGAKTFEEFTLIVGEPPILCPDDPGNGTAADNPYLPCDFVFDDNLKIYNENTVKDFSGTLEGRTECYAEASTYDTNEYIADCWPLLNNIRGVNKYGLWLEERDSQ